LKRPSSYNSARVLEQWAELGRNLPPARGQSPLDWGAVEKMIAAAQPKMHFEAGRLRELVIQSDLLLKPLTEPLSTNFGSLLERSNEMVYSDWLAWIVDQLGRGDAVLPLFGLDGFESKGKAGGEVLKAERESQITGGRLDLCIMRGESPIAVVEVKLDKAEQADMRSLGIYKNWLEEELGSSAKGRLVLLAVDGDKSEYDGFRLLKWSDLCLKLRRISPNLIRNKKVALAAMVLAFVGAVEQCLLRFSYDLVKRTVEKKNSTVSSAIPDYLAKFTRKENLMPTQPPEIRKLLERGIGSYSEAVRALREFRKEVLKQSKAALEGKISKASAAFSLKGLVPADIGLQALPNLGPHTAGEDDYTDLCATLELGSDCMLFVGLEWIYEANTGKIEPWAVVSVWIRSNRFDTYWEKVRGRDPDLHTVGNEIYLREGCPPREVGKLRIKLERMLDRWCVIWRKTGGIAALGKKA
jgi:hypothetical protein